MKLRQQITTQAKISQTLKNWFPILKANITDLEDSIKEYASSNPLVEVKSGFEKFNNKKYFKQNYISNSRSEAIEALTVEQESIYDKLFSQIVPPLFPTPVSQKIAKEIINNLDESGYFDGDIKEISSWLDVTEDDFLNIQQRFAYIEPVGIGARDYKESFLFQLENKSDISDELYKLTKEIINDFENIASYKNNILYNEVKKTIKSFRNPPINETTNDETIIPDIFIYSDENNNIEVKINDEFYPEVIIDDSFKNDNDFIKDRLKEAKNIVDAIVMRRQTLYKIGLEIIEKQWEYFNGGKLVPMKLQDIADELGYNSSTISRAIANKYIECNNGIIAIKEFFTTAVDDGVSNSSIKEFLQELIKHEDRKKPLSDNKIVQQIEKKFNLKLGRRTITKYRLQLNIESSSDRKKAYNMMDI